MRSLRIIFDQETWQEIFDSISKNKTRTVVTVVGVLWGIFIYISLSGAAKGLDNGFEREFENISKNSMFVWTQQTSVPYAGFKTGRQLKLKISDAAYLKHQIPEIEYISPRSKRGYNTPLALVIRNNKSGGGYEVFGDYPVHAKIFTKKIYDKGRFINEDDIRLKRKVCVIGERAQEELFEKGEEPVGKHIRIDGVYFQVVGVYKSVQGHDERDIIIPFETFQKLYNTGDDVGWFAIAAYNDADIVAVEKQIKQTLKRIHQVAPEDERAFGSYNMGDQIRRTMVFSRGMTFLSLIVGIATIIAGVIGIGNILLISVKERTKELGVRRALGATPTEVRIQIILESVFLTLVAGISGIVLGAFVLAGINVNTIDLLDFPYTNPTVPIPFILGALFIMISFGTLIGLIPAQRAVSIKPIDALREE